MNNHHHHHQEEVADEQEEENNNHHNFPQQQQQQRVISDAEEEEEDDDERNNSVLVKDAEGDRCHHQDDDGENKSNNNESVDRPDDDDDNAAPGRASRGKGGGGVDGDNNNNDPTSTINNSRNDKNDSNEKKEGETEPADVMDAEDKKNGDDEAGTTTTTTNNNTNGSPQQQQEERNAGCTENPAAAAPPDSYSQQSPPAATTAAAAMSYQRHHHYPQHQHPPPPPPGANMFQQQAIHQQQQQGPTSYPPALPHPPFQHNQYPNNPQQQYPPHLPNPTNSFGGGSSSNDNPPPLMPPATTAIPPPSQTQQQQVVDPHNHDQAVAMAQFYEARMRDHAAAYATAAAGAAWAAAQIAAAAAEFAAGTGSGNPPPPPPPPPPATTMGLPPPPPWNQVYGPQQQQQPQYPAQPMQAEQGVANTAAAAFNPSQTSSTGQPPLAYSNNRKGPGWPPPSHRNHSTSSSRPPPRKRQQRHSGRTADDSSIPRVIRSTTALSSSPSNHQQRGKIRRRLRSDGDSSTTSSGSSFMHRGSSNRGGGFRNKKKARSDESLLGKTAVSALYEWCSKRQRTPSLEHQQVNSGDFECIVRLDGGVGGNGGEALDDGDDDEAEIIGRGLGTSKAAAKQEAARKALQTLIPGIVFDEATGILIELPNQNDLERKLKAASLDDLAPHLAKQLAIGRDEDDASDNNRKDKADGSKKRSKPQTKRLLNVYPGTSTTSDEDDQNSHYASRDASVCSALLHAMVQIDARIRGPPSFSFEMVSPLSSIGGGTAGTGTCTNSGTSADVKPKRIKAPNNESSVVAARVTRGPFSCTARLRMVKGEPRTEKFPNESSHEDTTSSRPEDSGTASSSEFPREEEEVTTLEATGVGGTKRVARQVVAAQLLALLFPECETMVEVKASAEAAREAYAAGKTRKHQKQVAASAKARIQRRSHQPHHLNNHQEESDLGVFAFALDGRDDPPLPPELKEDFRALLGFTDEEDSSSFARKDDDIDDDQTASSDSPSSSVFRRLSRQKQVDSLVEVALQAVNEKDEEGRSLPEELTVDDVGRTILRRALPEDLSRIRRLLALDDDGDPESLAPRRDSLARLWSESSIVLLLCRAIAPLEDPPLGCAVLSPGFSMEYGRVLYLTRLASEPHLPRERFIECLQGFAAATKCKLEEGGHLNQQQQFSANEKSLTQEDLKMIAESHILSVDRRMTPSRSLYKSRNRFSGTGGGSVATSTIKRVSSPLQSVQEESEVSESSIEKRPTATAAAKRSNKPSKRSRVS